VVLPSVGTSGGIILACSQEFYSLSQIVTRRFSVTTCITNKRDNESWSVKIVYDLKVKLIRCVSCKSLGIENKQHKVDDYC
jgi:hypothetical protein